MRHIVVFLLCIAGAWGHGAHYHPLPWHATNQCTPDQSPHRCAYHLQVPDLGCTGDRCQSTAGHTAWFTNFTSVSEVTLPEDMFDHGTAESEAGLHPWNSPGAAPTYGDGCGLNGGNPDGCLGEDMIAGRCCGGGVHGGGCGGYVGGKSALDHYHDGLFGSPATTTWTRGQPAEVYWNSGAKHRGGYAYRLCKVNNGKYWHVTEECFQRGHLKFHGNTQWIYWQPNDVDYFHEEGWIPNYLVTTTEGTTPKHSEWAKIDVHSNPHEGDAWAFKDLVEVPEDLEPGDYVLSFRWDCQHTPQVWNSCSNIKIE